MRLRKLMWAVFLCSLAAVACFNTSIMSRAQNSSSSVIPRSDVMQPAELAKMLHVQDTSPPLLLQVGSHVFYAEAHIPGSVYAGAGSQPTGLKMLENMVSSSPKDKLIILYCGCCPWNRCPNVGPAYNKLHDLGFTNVKVLYIANNFGSDWVAKGYPIEKGE